VALVSSNLGDFGGGIYRGRKAPPNTVYDLVNGLINDEGLPYRRSPTPTPLQVGGPSLAP
jgi:hypothetical protein